MSPTSQYQLPAPSWCRILLMGVAFCIGAACYSTNAGAQSVGAAPTQLEAASVSGPESSGQPPANTIDIQKNVTAPTQANDNSQGPKVYSRWSEQGEPLQENGPASHDVQNSHFEQKGFFYVEVDDDDGDHVPDLDDLCPKTPLGTPVDNCGCPIPLADPCKIDTDNDGIVNCKDLCPATIPGTQVGMDGCPALIDPCRLDSDRDGVVDCRDSCPNTPSDVLIDGAGCPLPDPCRIDSDSDGIPDCRDRCPFTPKGLAVDEQGCVLIAQFPAVITIDVKFDFDKADIKPEFHSELDNFHDFVLGNPKLKIVLDGNTDAIGSIAYNIQLSDLRAQVVQEYLLSKQDIDPSRFGIFAHGKGNPIADNDTERGRAQNRRVNATISVIDADEARPSQGLANTLAKINILLYTPAGLPITENKQLPNLYPTISLSRATTRSQRLAELRAELEASETRLNTLKSALETTPK